MTLRLVVTGRALVAFGRESYEVQDVRRRLAFSPAETVDLLKTALLEDALAADVVVCYIARKDQTTLVAKGFLQQCVYDFATQPPSPEVRVRCYVFQRAEIPVVIFIPASSDNGILLIAESEPLFEVRSRLRHLLCRDVTIGTQERTKCPL